MANPGFPLPPDLPVPVNDGAAAHLQGLLLPARRLPATDGTVVDLGRLQGLWVIYVYPMTGRPGVPLPEGWDAIPGARGCTPQSCAFRDHAKALRQLGARVYGLSAQDRAWQQEARQRLHLPFQLLSDAALALKQSLRLPTFVAGGMELYKRLTLITENARIVKVFYPVFPPDRNADVVLHWLRNAAGDQTG